MTTKRCRLCAQDLPLESFALRTGSVWPRSECRACASADRTARRKARQLTRPEQPAQRTSSPTKTCASCNRDLPHARFRYANQVTGSRRSECNECERVTEPATSGPATYDDMDIAPTEYVVESELEKAHQRDRYRRH